jgi:hypothetical protein
VLLGAKLATGASNVTMLGAVPISVLINSVEGTAP